MSHDLLRDAADQEMRESGPPERSHDDDVGSLGGVEDRRYRFADDDLTRRQMGPRSKRLSNRLLQMPRPLAHDLSRRSPSDFVLGGIPRPKVERRQHVQDRDPSAMPLSELRRYADRMRRGR